MKVIPGERRQLPVEAAKGLKSETEAKLLKVEFGESSSQAVMEAFTIVRAFDKWGAKFRERAVMIRSDSSVAQAIARRLSSPHPSLNFLATELALRLEKFHHLRGSWKAATSCRGWSKGPTSRSRLDWTVWHLSRAAPWKACRFWPKAPGDATAEGRESSPRKNRSSNTCRRGEQEIRRRQRVAGHLI